MKRLLLILFLSFTLLVSCKTNYLSTKQKINTFKKLNCMLGKWVTYSTVYAVFENWKMIDDTTFKGKNIMILNNDTVLNEQMTIETGKNSINLYMKNLVIPDAPIENYKLEQIKTNKIVFKKSTINKIERITYYFVSPETLRILIESDGKSAESFNMKKFIK